MPFTWLLQHNPIQDFYHLQALLWMSQNTVHHSVWPFAATGGCLTANQSWVLVLVRVGEVEGWGGNRIATRKGGSNSSNHAYCYSIPLPSPIPWSGSMWTYTSYIVGAGPTKPSRPLWAYPTPNVPLLHYLISRRPPEPRTPQQDTTCTMLVQAHHCAKSWYWIGL